MLRSVLDLTDVQWARSWRTAAYLMTLDATFALRDVSQCWPVLHPIPLWRDTPDNIVGILHTKALFRAVEAAEETSNTWTSYPWRPNLVHSRI
jgi:Mg2+/Co2+ transporter CorB